MCAIIDANVVAEAFGNARTAAGQAFRDSVDQGKLRLVVGGELLDELDRYANFRRWLAQVSGARLLFSNDVPLHRDFKNRDLVDVPRGKVYSTREDTSFTQRHRRLLNDPALCNV